MHLHSCIRHTNRHAYALSLLLALILALGLLQPAQAQAIPSGYLVGWGWNHVGQLDIPDGLNDVIAVSANQTFSLALKSDGTVVGWGSNVSGQLDIPDGLDDVVAIAAGGDHSLALKRDGHVVAWGDDASGQSSVPDGLSNVTAIAAGDNHSLALKSDGHVVAWGCGGGYDYEQCSIPQNLSGVTAIAAGSQHSLALKNDGTVAAWGNNFLGQGVVPTGLKGVIAIAAGSMHNLVVKSNGTVFAWGNDDHEQTVVPTGLSGVIAVAGGHNHSVALKSDGTVVAWGGDVYGQTDVPEGLSGVIAIAAGWHTLALTQPPSVTVNQAAGQADPTTTTPIRFTASFSKPITGFTAADVTLSGTANRTNATIAISGGPSTYTISVGGITGSGTVVASIAANVASDANGYGNRASTSTDNSVNLNSNPPVITPNVVGTLGNNGWYVSNVTVSWTVVGNGAAVSTQTGCETQNITSDTSGVTFTCTATSVGGTSSQSVTIKRDATAPTIVAAATTPPNGNGWYKNDVTIAFTCTDAFSGIPSGTCPANQILKGEGASISSSAQTVRDAAGNTSSSANIVQVKIDRTAPVVNITGVANGASYPVGSAPTAACTTSDALSTVATQATLNVTGGSSTGKGTFIATCSGATDKAGNPGSARASYTVGIRQGRVVAWGSNSSHQTDVPVDLGGVIAISAGRLHSLALKSDGTVVGWGLNNTGQATAPEGLKDVIGIAAGGNHNVALKSDGTVVAWGSDSEDQLNVPATLKNVVAISAGQFHSLALKSDGTVVAWGFNTGPGGYLAVPANLNNVIAIGVGNYHSLALKSDGTVVAWGCGFDYGQCSTPAGLQNVVAIDAASEHNLAIKEDGTVAAWGLNTYDEATVPDDLSGVIAVSGGNDHSIALKHDGTVVAWGRSFDGATTIPDGLKDVFAVDAGAGHNLALVDAPEVAVNQAVQQADPATSSPVRFDVLFSEPVTGFTPGDVTLTGTANLAGATIAISGGPAAYTISVNGVAGNGTVVASLADGIATTADGKTNLASTSTDNSVTFFTDSTPPVITSGVAGTLGSNGWYKSNVAVSWTMVDNESTISDQAGCTTQSVTSDTSEIIFTCTATSLGGTASQSVTIKRDATAPTIALANRTAPNAAGWNSSAVTVNWTCSDATSGVVSASASKIISDEGAGQSATGSCADSAGNSASNTQSGINIDKTAPTVVAAATTSPNAAGWYNGDVTITFTCDDALSGIPSSACPPNQTLKGEGANISSSPRTVSDVAGNTSQPSNVVTAKIDRTAPTIVATATTSPNAAGWYNGDVTITFTCDDALSGLPSSACPPNQTLTGEGPNISSSPRTISDAAGNTSQPSNIVTAKIDRTAPTVSVIGVTNGAIYTLGAVPTAACSTADALSGVATQATPSLSGNGVGSYTATCAGATDAAGNGAAAASVRYTVGYAFVGFFAPVDNLPTINVANAGRTIPLKWRVIDASGNPITNLTSVTVTSVAGGCSASAPADTLEEYATSNTGLQHQGNGYYQFNWQTDRGWSGCRSLQVNLGDGVLRTALFQFR